MQFENSAFGSVRVDGVTYEHDVNKSERGKAGNRSSTKMLVR